MYVYTPQPKYAVYTNNSMHVCMCAYVCMHVYMDVCMHVYVCVCMCMCVYMYTCVYACMCVCMYVCAYVYVCVHACMRVCMRAYVYIYMYIIFARRLPKLSNFCQRAYAINLWEGYTSKKHLFCKRVKGRLHFQNSFYLCQRADGKTTIPRIIYIYRKVYGRVTLPGIMENYTSKIILLLNNVNWGGWGEEGGGREFEDGGKGN